MFRGHCVRDGGYMYANDRLGLGIDIDELKARALFDLDKVRVRRADGSVRP